MFITSPFSLVTSKTLVSTSFSRLNICTETQTFGPVVYDSFFFLCLSIPLGNFCLFQNIDFFFPMNRNSMTHFSIQNIRCFLHSNKSLSVFLQYLQVQFLISTPTRFDKGLFVRQCSWLSF